MQVWGTRIVVTPDIIYEILQVPLVSHPDYPACPHLRTMSKDELLSLFCETPSSWGDRQNTSCSGFVKGPRFLNMVLTFVLHPLSHYNSITEPHARLLLSLIEDLSIDFPSHFILFLIDVYKDMATRDKFIFPSAITRSFAIILLLNPSLLTSPSWVPLAQCLFDEARPSFNRSGHRLRQRLLQPLLRLLLLLRVVWCLRPSWHSLSAWMLALIHSLLSCIRWTPMLVASHDNGLAWVASSRLHLPLLLWRLMRMRMLIMVLIMMMRRRMRMLALPVIRRWWLLSDLPFVIHDKRGK